MYATTIETADGKQFDVVFTDQNDCHEFLASTGDILEVL